MEVYKASEIGKFRTNANEVLSRNFLCSIFPKIDNVDSFCIAYYDYEDGIWHEDGADEPVIEVKYFSELPCADLFNDGIAKIKIKEDAKKEQKEEKGFAGYNILVSYSFNITGEYGVGNGAATMVFRRDKVFPEDISDITEHIKDTLKKDGINVNNVSVTSIQPFPIKLA